MPVGRGGGQRTAAEHAPAPPPASPAPPGDATTTPRSSSLLSLTLCSLPRPLLHLPSTPERSSSTPLAVAMATGHPTPRLDAQKVRHSVLRPSPSHAPPKAPERPHRARPQPPADEIASATPTAPVLPRARRSLLYTRREPLIPSPLTVLALVHRSHRTLLARMGHRFCSPPTYLRPPIGPAVVLSSLPAPRRARRCPARATLATVASTPSSPELRRPPRSTPVMTPAIPGPTAATTRRGRVPASRRCPPPAIWSPEEESRSRRRVWPRRRHDAGGFDPADQGV